MIVPCYNYARFLPSCISSILTQDRVEVEVLIIDDASSDDTAEVARALARKDPRISVRQHIENKGHISTYNEGLDWASGRYTVLLSADDLLTHGSLGRATELMDVHPSVGLVYGRTIFLRPDRRPPEPCTNERGWTIWSGREWLQKRCRSSNNNISSPEVVLRTSLVKKLGGFEPDLPHTADLEFWMRCAAHGDIGYVRRAHQAYYRIHPDSMLRQHYSAPMVDIRARKAAFDTLFRNHGDRIPDREHLQELADRALARDALWEACRAFDRGRTESVPIREMIEFATTIYGRATSLSEFRGLRWRTRVGPRICQLLQPALIASPLSRRLRAEWAWRSVQRRGV